MQVLAEKGQNHCEIARVMGVTEGTVRYHLRRAGAVDRRKQRELVRRAGIYRAEPTLYTQPFPEPRWQSPLLGRDPVEGARARGKGVPAGPAGRRRSQEPLRRIGLCARAEKIVVTDSDKKTAVPMDYAQLHRDLVKAVDRVCPRWMADRADDLVQVALMRVMEIQRKREGTAEFSIFYLRKAAYSALIDEIRRLRRRQEVSLEGPGDEEEAASFDPAAPEPDPERASTGREVGRAIRDCLGLMVPPRRHAVTLSLQGHSVPEIGRLLGWTAKKAENLVYRGMADLRGCLGEKGIQH